MLRAIFQHGMVRTPPVVLTNPAALLEVRREDVPDPTEKVTFNREQVFAIADAVDEHFEALVLLRGTSSLRSGQAAALAPDDIDLEDLGIVAHGSEGTVSSRFSDGAGRRCQAPLKHQNKTAVRAAPLWAHPRVLAALAAAVEAAPGQYARRETLLRRRIRRWTREKRPEMLERAERELEQHQRAGVRLFTMKNGAPLDVEKFDRDVFKPALRSAFPDVPDDPELTAQHRVLRELRLPACEAFGDVAGLVGRGSALLEAT